MKRTLSLIALSVLAISAHATYYNPPNQGNNGPTVNANFTADIKSPLATSSSVSNGGAGGSATGVGGDVTSTINPTINSSIGGSGGNNLSVGSGAGANSNNVTFQKSAPGVGVNSVTPIFSDCRRTINVGASSQGGSGVASGIPLWRESDCQGAQGVQIMKEAGVFTVIDIQTVACTVSALQETPTCKALAESTSK